MASLTKSRQILTNTDIGIIIGKRYGNQTAKCWQNVHHLTTTEIHSPRVSMHNNACNGKHTLANVTVWPPGHTEKCFFLLGYLKRGSLRCTSYWSALVMWLHWLISTCHFEHYEGYSLQGTVVYRLLHWQHRASMPICPMGSGGAARIFAVSSPFCFLNGVLTL